MEIADAGIARYGLVHGNDIVIYTYEIQQIHITFIGLVHLIDMVVISTSVYAVYSQSMLIDT